MSYDVYIDHNEHNCQKTRKNTLCDGPSGIYRRFSKYKKIPLKTICTEPLNRIAFIAYSASLFWEQRSELWSPNSIRSPQILSCSTIGFSLIQWVNLMEHTYIELLNEKSIHKIPLYENIVKLHEHYSTRLTNKDALQT